MGKLIVVIGNVGSGKTTFVRQLCAVTDYRLALEDHSARPFHGALAAGDQNYALHNQLDFLLHRAEQEQIIRDAAGVGVMDGGLEQDFWIFTRFFAARGLLSAPEQQLCERVYRIARRALPRPDLAIVLTAPVPILTTRYARRSRAVEVVRPTDLTALQALVDEWRSHTTCPLLTVDAAADDPGFARTVAALEEPIRAQIGA